MRTLLLISSLMFLVACGPRPFLLDPHHHPDSREGHEGGHEHHDSGGHHDHRADIASSTLIAFNVEAAPPQQHNGAFLTPQHEPIQRNFRHNDSRPAEMRPENNTHHPEEHHPEEHNPEHRPVNDSKDVMPHNALIVA